MSDSETGPVERLPTLVEQTAEPPRRGRRPGAASAGGFDAQVLGQGGVRRGLRGGAPILEEAQHAYLEAEWSGPSDRRASAGTTRREKV